MRMQFHVGKILLKKVSHSFRPFCQDLINMLSGSQHHLNDLLDKFVWNLFMEKVTHGVNEYHSRPFPFDGNVKVVTD